MLPMHRPYRRPLAPDRAAADAWRDIDQIGGQRFTIRRQARTPRRPAPRHEDDPLGRINPHGLRPLNGPWMTNPFERHVVSPN